MKILAHVHGYPPHHNAGAEWALHGVLADLVARHGADVRVVVTRRPTRRNGPETVDGVTVVHERTWRALLAHYGWADVAVTHLDVTARAMGLAERTRTPLAHYVHNDAQLVYHGVTPARWRAALVVWNSRWLADPDWTGRSLTVNPPVWPDWYRDRHRPGPRDAVLFVNPMEAKGAATVWRLAERMPRRPFVVVAGGYGTPLNPPTELRNVERLPNKPGLDHGFRRARLVVMPSHYESWGRVAIEAATLGIPSVCADTPGLVETGIGWTYLRHDDVAGWARAIDALDDPDVYRLACDAARDRADRLAGIARSQIDALAAALADLG